MEVSAFVNDTIIKAISLTFTSGLSRGDEPLDKDVEYKSIHQTPVPFSQKVPLDEIFLTGIKMIDLLTPLPKDIVYFVLYRPAPKFRD